MIRTILIATTLIAFGVVAARAIPSSQQIIIFGGGSNASGGSGGACTMNGVFDLTNTCNDIYLLGRLI